jgi:hypothetical protein
MLHNRIKTLQLLYYATLFCNLNIMLIHCSLFKLSLLYLYGPMGCLLAYKDPISFLIIRANWPKCRANGPDTAKRQGSILSLLAMPMAPRVFISQQTTHWTMLHNRIKTLQLLYYATLFCNLNIMLIVV